MILVTCPTCEAALRARDDLRGKVVLCPKCGHATPVGFQFQPHVYQPIDTSSAPRPRNHISGPDDQYRVEPLESNSPGNESGQPGEPITQETIQQTLRETDAFLRQIRRRGRLAHLWPIADVDLPDWCWIFVWLGLTFLPTACYVMAIGWPAALGYTMGNFLVGGIVTALFASRLHPFTWLILGSWVFVAWAGYPRPQ